MSENLYKEIDVWARKNGAVVRYRCFEVLPDKGYCVQSADFYQPPFTQEKAIQHEKQFLELFLEERADSRSEQFSSLTEAIAAFDREFIAEDPSSSD